MQLASIKYFSLHQEQWLIACTSILMLIANMLLVQAECNSWDRLTEDTKKQRLFYHLSEFRITHISTMTLFWNYNSLSES